MRGYYQEQGVPEVGSRLVAELIDTRDGVLNRDGRGDANLVEHSLVDQGVQVGVGLDVLAGHDDLSQRPAVKRVLLHAVDVEENGRGRPDGEKQGKRDNQTT